MDLGGTGFPYGLRRRFVGRLDETPNLIINGGFETDLAAWTTFGGATASWDASTGPDANPGVAELSLSSVGVGGIFQDSIPVGGLPFDTFLWITAWCNIGTGVFDYMVPPDGGGIVILLHAGATFLWQQAATPDWRIKGQWQRVRMKVYMPGGLGAVDLLVQLRTPENLIQWDQVVVHQEERLYAAGDPGTIISLLVTHAQDTSIGKTDLFINTDTARSGYSGGFTTVRAYKYSSRANILSAMNEFAGIDGGVDWVGEQPARNTRTIFVYDPQGYEPPGGREALVLGDNIQSYEWVWSTDDHADRCIAMGRGDGFEVDEGVAIDAGSPDLGWEQLKPAQIEAVNDTQQTAEGMLQLAAQPVILRVTVQRTETFDPVELCKGDGPILPARLVDVTLVEGQVDINAMGMKIVKTALNPEPHTAVLDLVHLPSSLS
jgi:hypothetical protein